MNVLNPLDVVGSFPADKGIEVGALKPIPGRQPDRVQELVEAAHKPLYVYA